MKARDIKCRSSMKRLVTMRATGITVFLLSSVTLFNENPPSLVVTPFRFFSIHWVNILVWSRTHSRWLIRRRTELRPNKQHCQHFSQAKNPQMQQSVDKFATSTARRKKSRETVLGSLKLFTSSVFVYCQKIFSWFSV